jgi:hypothetical protein
LGVKEIKTEDYSVGYDATSQTITFSGSLRLSGMDEYAPIVELLDEVAHQGKGAIALNLENLKFLNSSGINVLSKFVIKVRQNANTSMVVKGSKTIPWQSKSLKNLQRLMPSLTLEWE